MQTTEIKRLFDILQFQAENQPIDDALASKVNGEWVKYSSKDLQNIANKVSLGLMRMVLEIMLPWLSITPLGKPVVPEV